MKVAFSLHQIMRWILKLQDGANAPDTEILQLSIGSGLALFNPIQTRKSYLDHKANLEGQIGERFKESQGHFQEGVFILEDPESQDCPKVAPRKGK
ncbi:hypothetical protein Pfo_023959 [Paulownia fortunei]|nr:hypothetical protein Pfo_023959 [Paulownia fortunei]